MGEPTETSTAAPANGCGPTAWLAAILVVVAIAIGAAVLGGQSDEDSASDTGRQESVEYMLATLDGSFPSGEDDPALRPYGVVLDTLERKCTNTRSRLGDFAVVGRQTLTDGGESVELLGFLRAMNESIPPNAPRMDCADVAAAIVTLMLPG